MLNASAPLHQHVMHYMISTTSWCIYIHCVFLSSHISPGKKAANGKMVNVLHLLLPECYLTHSTLRGSQLKLYQKWTGKIYWGAKLYAVNQEMVARFCHHIIFPERSVRWRVETEGRLASDLPDCKVMNAVRCENTFLHKCHGVMFLKGCV